MRRLFYFLLSLTLVLGCRDRGFVFLEAESFDDAGGWVVDQQGMDVRGTSWMLAHGAGVPVDDASTRVALPCPGRYHAWVLTRNWTAPWSDKEGPGAFSLAVDGQPLGKVCGTTGGEWHWQYAGAFRTGDSAITLSLQDRTGFDGRCDAVCLSRSRHIRLPADGEGLHRLHREMDPQYDKPRSLGTYDFVVVGGGISGICAAVAAARQGLKVAIVNNRPVLGGNNSAEIRVHLGGRIELDPYPNLGNLIKEFGHKKCSNADAAEKFGDDRKEGILREEGVDIFMPYHACAVTMDADRILSVHCRHISNGELISLEAPLFADCTGDGSLGALAGADFRVGREARSEHGESMAPETADDKHLGASLLWNTKEENGPAVFPEFSYGLDFTEESVIRATSSKWDWETGLDRDMVTEVERIRDFGLLAVYSNWSFLKNHDRDSARFRNRALDWVAYITGKRESRRLMGDYILTENDLVDAVPHPDGTCSASWGIDLHEPDSVNARQFPGKPFKTVARHKYFKPYPIPYRCLYSRNIANLFMAGRDISCTHVAMGAVRVIRTCGMMGEVVGMAASVCHRHASLPRSVYTDYFQELVPLMEAGAGKQGLPNDQDFCIHGCYNPADPAYRHD
jgi:hypothetical protein